MLASITFFVLLALFHKSPHVQKIQDPPCRDHARDACVCFNSVRSLGLPILFENRDQDVERAGALDGTPAPLLWVQDAQINVVAPWSLTPGQNTQVCVSYNNVNTNCLTLPVVQGNARCIHDRRPIRRAALNQDGNYNSRVVLLGSTMVETT
jgi:hypothetical protein